MSQFNESAPMRKGMSGGAKVAIGCGAVTILTVVVLCSGVVGLAWFAKAKLEKAIKDYEDRGYVTVGDEIVTVDELVAVPTIFTGQTVTLNAGSAEGVAIFCESATLTGHFAGDVDFMGQQITFGPNAVIEGDINILAAQQVSVGDRAVIQGRIEIKWGVQILTIGEGAQVWGQVNGAVSEVRKPEGWKQGPPAEGETGEDDGGGG